MAANGSDGVCVAKPRSADPLNWGKAAQELSGSHLDAVKRMVEEYRRPVAGKHLTLPRIKGKGEAREGKERRGTTTTTAPRLSTVAAAAR